MASTFDYLDLGPFRELYCSAEKPAFMRFYIEGVKCSKCVEKIERLKTPQSDIKGLSVNLATHIAEIELGSSSQSFESIASKISELGFKPIPLQVNQDPELFWKKESRADLIRLAVAAFCAGNIMLFSFSVYFGLGGDLKHIFELLQLALYMPVVTYVAMPFYRGFFQSIRDRKMSIDTPMALVSFLSFVISTWNLAQGFDSIYYDSTASFLFLILGTRYFQKSLRHRYLGSLRPSHLMENSKALLFENGSTKWVRADQLKKGQIIEVALGDLVPADGELVSAVDSNLRKSESATFDVSFLNGENLPKVVSKGGKISAGSICLVNRCQVSVVKVGADTLFGHLMNSVIPGETEKTEYHRISDVASQILLSVVIFVSLVLLLIPNTDFRVQFEKAFALLVLACPCAMAFGTPLAFSFSIQKAFKHGILIKSAAVFDLMLSAKNIFLDKTGTVTHRHWTIRDSNLSVVPTLYKKVILALEAKSQHPIAYAFRDQWKEDGKENELGPVLQVEGWQEIAQVGVQGHIEGQFWSLVATEEDGQKFFMLSQNQNPVWKFVFEPGLQKDAHQIIVKLLRQGYKIFLVSGDHQAEANRVGSRLGLGSDVSFGDLSPDDKKLMISRSQNSVMIGDGYNDALALKAANVGIAVGGGVDLAMRAASVVFLKEGIESIYKLIQISQKARRQIQINLLVALVYNTLGGVAAVMGLINPFIAALLMPVSSILILFFTWLGTAEKEL